MVCHLADTRNRCADVFGQMHRTDVQMKLLNMKSLQMAVQKVKVLDQTNKLLVKSQSKEKTVMLVVQMVRVLAQIARGVGLSPTWCYTFPCVVCF